MKKVMLARLLLGLALVLGVSACSAGPTEQDTAYLNVLAADMAFIEAAVVYAAENEPTDEVNSTRDEVAVEWNSWQDTLRANTDIVGDRYDLSDWEKQTPALTLVIALAQAGDNANKALATGELSPWVSELAKRVADYSIPASQKLESATVEEVVPLP